MPTSHTYIDDSVINRQLLWMLHVVAQFTASEIGELLGWPRKRVREELRRQKLTRAGLITCRAQNQEVCFAVFVWLGLKAPPTLDETKLRKALRKAITDQEVSLATVANVPHVRELLRWYLG